jgi:hypothetical protein
MPRPIGLLSIVGFFGLLAAANAQTAPAPTAFDGTYRPVSSTKANAMYTDKTGRMAPMPEPKAGAAPHRERGGYGIPPPAAISSEEQSGRRESWRWV